jgi:hypothetical protein
MREAGSTQRKEMSKAAKLTSQFRLLAQLPASSCEENLNDLNCKFSVNVVYLRSFTLRKRVSKAAKLIYHSWLPAPFPETPVFCEPGVVATFAF